MPVRPILRTLPFRSLNPQLRSFITSSRYRSMVTDYVTPMDKTYSVLGAPKFSLQEGVEETLTWLRTQPAFTDLPPST